MQARIAGHPEAISCTRYRENACGLIRIDARRPRRGGTERRRTRSPIRASTTSQYVERLVCSSRAGRRRKRRVRRQGLADMRRGVELLREQNRSAFRRPVLSSLAEPKRGGQCRPRQSRSSTKRLAKSERPATARSSGTASRPRRNAAQTRPRQSRPAAEEAFLDRHRRLRKQQGTRSFELRAALALAKLYQSIGRPAEAHAVLAPALEGFAPTPRNARDRRGAGAAGCTRGDRRGQEWRPRIGSD